MKLAIILALFGACAAAPQGFLGFGNYQAPRAHSSHPGHEANAQILRSDSEVNEQGFHYSFETDNGITAEETGQEAGGIQASGGYSYTGDDGQVYSIRYTADSNGFQPQGAHIPTPPPIPEEIVRALEQNARDEASGIFDDGSYNAGKYADASAGVARIAPAPYKPVRQFQAPRGRFY